ncbi:MAG: ribosome silencing factor [Thermoleophilia bacterium]|nr:ribosome silencing factor [Thermoleophilia bacterium]
MRGELRLAVRALEAHKAVDILVLDLRRVSDAADFFVIASGTSNTHVRTLAERTLEAIESAGGHAHHVEGVPAGRWALLDLVTIVVHVFHPTLRQYYQLERLWSDAPVLSTELVG